MILTGCAGVMSPVSGALYMSVKGPLAISPQPGMSKTGTASASSILGLIAMGDASIEAAAKAGGITKIHNVTHVDVETMNILGLYVEYTTVVYGD